MKIKNNYILRLNELAKLLWIIILLGACQSDDSYSVQQDAPVLVKLSVSAADAGTASGNDTGTDAQITSIYILQFNADADSYGTLRYVAEGKKNTGGTYTANLLQSMGANDNYKLVILANLLFCMDCMARATRMYSKPALARQSLSPLFSITLIHSLCLEWSMGAPPYKCRKAPFIPATQS